MSSNPNKNETFTNTDSCLESELTKMLSKIHPIN